MDKLAPRNNGLARGHGAGAEHLARAQSPGISKALVEALGPAQVLPPEIQPLGTPQVPEDYGSRRLIEILALPAAALRGPASAKLERFIARAGQPAEAGFEGHASALAKEGALLERLRAHRSLERRVQAARVAGEQRQSGRAKPG